MTADQQPYCYILDPSSTESEVNRLSIFFQVFLWNREHYSFEEFIFTFLFL